MPTLTDPKWTTGLPAITFARTTRHSGSPRASLSARQSMTPSTTPPSTAAPDQQGTISRQSAQLLRLLFAGNDGTIIDKVGAIITGVHNGITLRGDGTMITDDER